MGAALTQLIPVQELPAGQISAIRNSVIDNLVRQVSKELNRPETDLVVRDLRPVEDLVLYSTGTTAATINDWVFTTAASTTQGFVTITGDQTMGDQRFVAIFGVKDLREVYGIKQAAATVAHCLPQYISLIKINVGGTDKAMWDISKLQCYEEHAGICPSACIIPQNTLYNLSLYKSLGVSGGVANIVFDGIVVEPRAKTVSP